MKRCGPTVGADFWHPDEITFATINSTQYAYMPGYMHYAIYQCFLKSSGRVKICNKMPVPQKTDDKWWPRQVEFAVINGTQYAYVLHKDISLIHRCTLSESGAITTCDNAGNYTSVDRLNQPRQLTVRRPISIKGKK
jgi:hypothetical protein